MGIKKELLLSYSLAVGAWNFIFTLIILVILTLTVPSITFDLNTFLKSYLMGYVVLWVLSLGTIRE